MCVTVGSEGRQGLGRLWDQVEQWQQQWVDVGAELCN